MMRHLLITVILLSPLSLWAANSNAGTSGAAFLKLGAGARPTAMGNSFVSVADDANAVYFNPAGLSQIERPQVTALHTQYFQDINYNFGAFVYPLQTGVFAISAQTLKIDNIDRTGLDESNLGKFENTDGAYAISYGRNLRSHFSGGVTVRFIDQEIDRERATAYGLDLGVMKKVQRFPMSLGLAIKNIGTKIKFRDESDPQPLTLDLGASKEFFRDRLLFSANVYKPRDNDVLFGVGSEWDQPLGEEFGLAFRAGYNSLGTDADGTTGLSLGGGFGFKRLDFDFAWVPFGDLGNTTRYAVLFHF